MISNSDGIPRLSLRNIAAKRCEIVWPHATRLSPERLARKLARLHGLDLVILAMH